MYTVLLVDDERSLRESIQELVDWEGNGFKLIGTAENGLDALQLMEKVGSPDLLITDIKMPVMTGIELAQHVKDEYPTTKVVFLSGYDEFQYAKAGIELNIFQYLLKPISEQEIEKTLATIEKQISNEIRAANDLTQVKKEYLDQLEVMKISFLISLLTETYTNVTQQALEDFIGEYKLDFLQNGTVLLTIQLKEESQDVDLIRFSLSNVIRSILTKYSAAEVFLFSGNIVCLMPVHVPLETINKEIIESALKVLNQEIYIGVSEAFSDILATKKAYRQAIEALDFARYTSEGNIIHVTDIEVGKTTADTFENLDEYSLQLAMKTGDMRTVREQLDKVLKKNNNLNLVASLLYITAIRSLYDSGVEMRDDYTNWYHEFVSQSKYHSASVAAEEIRSFCQKVVNEIAGLRKRYTNTMVAQSLNYMNENFQDADLSLQTVSKHLSLSPTYFSAVFKKETGQSFIEALTEMKMNHAKKLVLTTSHKMFEIAQASGYNDQHYFSYSFKKYFGISPTQMRRELAQV